MAHLYIHIPFCLSKCSYCSFVSFPNMNHLFDRYVKAIGEELRAIASGPPAGHLQTMFFGGGTPSLLSIENIADIFAACRSWLTIDEETEITMEINPKTVDFLKLLSLKKLGINRLSIGVQSFCDKGLQFLGRLHTAQEACEAVEWAKKSGYTNINIDLMSGLPGQTVELWRWDLQTAIELDPTHLSLYQLTVEEGTDLDAQIKKGNLVLPQEDDVLAMDNLTVELSTSSGFDQYEISNFSKPGFSCRHNINYWKNGEHYAVGAAAVRYLAGERSRNVDNPRSYCTMIEQGGTAVVESENLDLESSFRETVVMGLRMLEGVSMEDLYQRYGIDLQAYYGKTMEKLLQMSLLQVHDSFLRLTPQGRAVANQVLADLV